MNQPEKAAGSSTYTSFLRSRCWLPGSQGSSTLLWQASVIDFIEIRETPSERGFNRFCDMSGLEAVRVSSRDVFNLSARRRAFNPNDIPVKSAFRAPDPLAFGIARMYERMLNSPRIEVRVFADLKAAADWLGVSPDKLTI